MPSEQEGPGQVKSRSGHPTLSRATIVRRKDFTDDLFVLWLEPESQFPFEPGQYITIGVEGVEHTPPDRPLQRSRAVGGIVSFAHELLLRRIG